jgi:hypothetical protein
MVELTEYLTLFYHLVLAELLHLSKLEHRRDWHPGDNGHRLVGQAYDVE